MFFLLSKILDLAFSPLAWALALLAAAVLFRRRRAAPWLAGGAALVLYLFSVEPVSDRLARFAEAGARSTFRPDVVYDAAIVLGGGVDPGASEETGRIELNGAGDRVLAGYELLRSGRVRSVLLSAGGPEPQDPVEADWAAGLYRNLGIAPERIVVERESRNTRENALYSARIVRERGWRSLLLVTSAMHAPRALATFRAVGLSPDLLPVDARRGAGRTELLPRASALELSTDALRELAGRLVYRMVGYGRS